MERVEGGQASPSLSYEDSRTLGLRTANWPCHRPHSTSTLESATPIFKQQSVEREHMQKGKYSARIGKSMLCPLSPPQQNGLRRESGLLKSPNKKQSHGSRRLRSRPKGLYLTLRHPVLRGRVGRAGEARRAFSVADYEEWSIFQETPHWNVTLRDSNYISSQTWQSPPCVRARGRAQHAQERSRYW